MKKYTSLIFFALFLFSCAKKPKIEEEETKWGIYPNSTVLNQSGEFALRGENLFNAAIISGPSVKVQKLNVKPDGTTMKTIISVKPLEEDDPVDVLGVRVLQVRSGSRIKEIELYILDEKKSNGFNPYE